MTETDDRTDSAAPGAGQTAGETPEPPEEPRRAAVRRLVLQRLDAAGMRRPRTLDEAGFAEMRRRLVAHLDYLPDAALVTLADLLIRMAGGRDHNLWPDEATVRGRAEALLPAPVERAPIITSWLRSVEGPRAREGGYLTELYRALLRSPQPPGAYGTARIVAEAEENRRWRAHLRDRAAEGSASAADHAWLAAYAADEARALQLVDDGAAARAARAAGRGAA